MSTPRDILLVEDEANFGAVLKNYLELSRYNVTLADNGEKGLRAFKRSRPDLCILDVMMPEKDGFTLAREIKEIDEDVPLIFLTARNMKEDQLNGFRIGADDYITKPFDTELLLYKIQAVLKRSVVDEEEKIEEFEFGHFKFNSRLRTLTDPSDSVRLSPKENDLLKCLCDFLNDVMPRNKALLDIWKNDDYFTKRSMDVYIAKLRKRLKSDPNVEIENIHSSGYRLIVR